MKRLLMLWTFLFSTMAGAQDYAPAWLAAQSQGDLACTVTYYSGALGQQWGSIGPHAGTIHMAEDVSANQLNTYLMADSGQRGFRVFTTAPSLGILDWTATQISTSDSVIGIGGQYAGVQCGVTQINYGTKTAGAYTQPIMDHTSSPVCSNGKRHYHFWITAKPFDNAGHATNMAFALYGNSTCTALGQQPVNYIYWDCWSPTCF